MLRETKPDFVDIATTVPSPPALVELAARHGVPAICQKPFAPDPGRCEAMVGACAEAGVPLMVHENFRWQPPLRAVRELVDSGQIGTPHFGARSPSAPATTSTPSQPYLATEERFIIEDVGIHVLDMARFFFGEVARSPARTKRVNPKIKGEDVATMLLRAQEWRHVGGRLLLCDASCRDPFPETLIEIDGDRGAMRLEQGYRLGRSPAGPAGVREARPGPCPGPSGPGTSSRRVCLAIQEHWVDCLRAGVEPETSGADNLKTFALVEAAYRSAASGETVHL